jgi:hypothetical protein
VQFCASGCWCWREDSNLHRVLNPTRSPWYFSSINRLWRPPIPQHQSHPRLPRPHGHDVRLTARCVGLTADQRELRSNSRLASRPDA